MKGIVIYDRETGEVLRPANPREADQHYASDLRDDPPIDGTELGYPGRHVWLDLEDPRKAIEGWAPDGTPVFDGWPYEGTEWWPGEKPRKVACTAQEALRFAREPKAARDHKGRVCGSAYGADGARVIVHYDEDWGLPPESILAVWRARYWPDGTDKPARQVKVA